ncbi:5-hydroxytryptamine receptor-like [Oratosquilla oratoria]|uniref:5-hydroxytryptamine receptor-like n=1 Tax=Oratosquilla oratoria TaxID=337810 RepID=UPI003F758E4D
MTPLSGRSDPTEGSLDLMQDWDSFGILVDTPHMIPGRSQPWTGPSADLTASAPALPSSSSSSVPSPSSSVSLPNFQSFALSSSSSSTRTPPLASTSIDDFVTPIFRWVDPEWREDVEVYSENLFDIANTSVTVFNETWKEIDNDGGNRTAAIDDLEARLLIPGLTAFVLGVMILATIIGNVFVIAAILLERHLQSVANYLILSLAVADLLVAALVMPLSAVYEVSKKWNLGPELCDMWTASDVLCCSASILHLVAIALDRYWAVTNVDYIQHRSTRRIVSMITVIWTTSFLISAAPMMGWKDPEWTERVQVHKMCLVSQDLGYQVFATMSSFYVPLFVILVLYWRIYQTARKRIRRKIGANAHTALCKGPVTISETTALARISSTQPSPEKSSATNGASLNGHSLDGGGRCSGGGSGREDSSRSRTCESSMSSTQASVRARRREGDAKRERKAAKTLAIITGAFVVCWLPFFILAVLMPLCDENTFNPYLISTLLWLGYFNSTLNPIIYTIFSPEFRHAFKRILCGRNRSLGRYSSRYSSARFTRS